ncbi:MAG: SDR family NAD(P)-dependent oxidoreductase [Alphaproteobacteria bacterium]|nr:SDR family NAD(P)-dependent oxidoreductase [Alphaproteobacteria bacterium]
MDVNGTVAVISGGASGLGEATVRRLLDGGARGIAVLDLNATRGQALAAEAPDRILFCPADVSDEAAVDAAVAAALARFGSLQLAIHAAAIGGAAKLVSSKGPLPMALFDRVLKINLYGALHMMRAAVIAMQRNVPNADGERGVLINVSSGAAFEGQVGQVAYSASKAALVGMTLPLCRELAPFGIRVVTIAPGAFDTPIYDGAPPALKDSIVREALFPKRMGKPDEFAMLAEEIVRNPMHNGRTYRLDAGMILRPSG